MPFLGCEMEFLDFFNGATKGNRKIGARECSKVQKSMVVMDWAHPRDGKKLHCITVKYIPWFESVDDTDWRLIERTRRGPTEL